MKALFNLVIVIVGIIFLAIFFKYGIDEKLEKVERMNKEYPSLDFEQPFRGRVTEIKSRFEGLKESGKNAAYVTIDYSLKKRLITGETLEKGLYLMDVLEINDSIVKEEMSNVIQIIKTSGSDTSKYFLELQDN